MKKAKKAKVPAKKRALKLFGKLTLLGFLTFLVTFTIYMFNLENKLHWRFGKSLGGIWVIL